MSFVKNDKLTDLVIGTKWGHLKTSVPSEQTGTLALIIIFAIISLISTLINSTTSTFLPYIFLALSIVSAGIFLYKYSSKNPTIEMLNQTQEYEQNVLGHMIPMEDSVYAYSKEIALKAIISNYERCYFSSIFYENPELAKAIKEKIDGLKEEVKRVDK